MQSASGTWASIVWWKNAVKHIIQMVLKQHPSGTPVVDRCGEPTLPDIWMMRCKWMNMDLRAIRYCFGIPIFSMIARIGILGIWLKHFTRSTVAPTFGVWLKCAVSTSQRIAAINWSEPTPAAVLAICGGNTCFMCWMILMERHLAHARYMRDVMVMGRTWSGLHGVVSVLDNMTTLAFIKQSGQSYCPISIPWINFSNHSVSIGGIDANSCLV